MAQPSNTQSRSSYSSPPSYPSPSMSAYAYPPPTSGQAAEPYRASPTGSQVSLPSLNLPPIRNMDGRQQGQAGQPTMAQQQTSGQTAMGSPIAPPMNQYQQYQQAQMMQQGHVNLTSDPNQPIRYPISPATDNRMMSGGRHKKEIKRRTKTGCLTCRKRRIKCDEGHPTCRNCIKSKRDCLGYDPIFKAQPAPAPIQPAPSAGPSMQSLSATSSPYPPPPQGYMTATTQPYVPNLTGGATSPDSSVEPFDYTTAIDPALEGTGSSNMQVHSFFTVRPTKVEDLLDVGNVPPPRYNPGRPLQPAEVDEIKHFFHTFYANALDKFFETRWFSTRALSYLLANQKLAEKYVRMLERMKVPQDPADYSQVAPTTSLEAHVIWETLLLCRQVSAANSTNGVNNAFDLEEGVHEAAKRLKVFETLITNMYLDDPTISIAPTSQNGHELDKTLKHRELEFWRLVAKFLTLKDDEASSAAEIDETLTAVRSLLDTRENRDVIYSICIARCIGQRMAEGGRNFHMNDDSNPPTNDESDPRNKLKVARDFLQGEANGRGTTTVVQRFCGMAVRSWGDRR